MRRLGARAGVRGSLVVLPQLCSLPPTPPRPRRRARPRRAPGAHDEECFGCGGKQSHGLHLEAAWRASPSRRSSRYGPPTRGAPGLAHGGALATALDETLGSLNWLLRTIAVTGRLETDFALPVPVDTALYLEAEVTAVAGRKIYSTATGRIGGPDGPVAVRADALFVEVKVDHFIDNGRPAEIRLFDQPTGPDPPCPGAFR